MASRTLEQHRARMEADFLRIDGLEPVTLQRPDPEGLGEIIASVPIPYALRRALDKQSIVETQAGISNEDRYVAGSELCIWHVPLRILLAVFIVPSKGDYIIDSDVTKWIVWRVETHTFRTRYRLTCVRE